MTRAREEQGFVLVTALVLLTVMMSLGLGLLLFTDNQQRSSTREQATEAAFDVAEAALNAQIGQLAHHWPTAAGEEQSSCSSAEAGSTTNSCPYQPNLSAAYSYLNRTSTCTGGPVKDAWGSSLNTEWTTYVRDNGSTPSSVYNSSTVQSEVPYDSNGDGKLWVRAVGVVQCHPVTLISLVSEQSVPISFPENAVTGNWFDVTNNGNKDIINRTGDSNATQAGAISMRCEAPLPVSPCESYEAGKKEQVSPALTEDPTSSRTTLTSIQLEALKTEAVAHNTYYSTATHCPSSIAELTGIPTYVENCGELKIKANGEGNSLTSPGFLVIANGTFELSGTSTFYGVIYAPNPTNLSSAVIKLQGHTEVVGEIDVDGLGGIEFGSSGTSGSNVANLVYDPLAVKKLKLSAGAAATRNSFRQLPAGQ